MADVINLMMTLTLHRIPAEIRVIGKRLRLFFFESFPLSRGL
jgi:hypothetical protein